MSISRSSYEGALKKLNLPDEILYDESGIIRPEHVLTDAEKEALLLYVGSDRYLKKDNAEYGERVDEASTKYSR